MLRPCQAGAFCTREVAYPVPVSVSWPLVTRMRPSGLRVADGYLRCTSAMYSRLETLMSLLLITYKHTEVHHALLEARVHCTLMGLSAVNLNFITTPSYPLQLPYIQSQMQEDVPSVCEQPVCLVVTGVLQIET